MENQIKRYYLELAILYLKEHPKEHKRYIDFMKGLSREVLDELEDNLKQFNTKKDLEMALNDYVADARFISDFLIFRNEPWESSEGISALVSRASSLLHNIISKRYIEADKLGSICGNFGYDFNKSWAFYTKLKEEGYKMQ